MPNCQIVDKCSQNISSGCFCFLEFQNILLDLLHALLVEGVAVAKEKEHLKENKQWGSDKGLVPRVEKSRCAAFKDTMPNELRNPGGNMEGKNSLPEWESCHRGSSCHQPIGPLVEDKHEERSQATSDRVHHDVGDHIDGSGDGGQGEGHPAKEGEGGKRGRGWGEDAQHVLQRHP